MKRSTFFLLLMILALLVAACDFSSDEKSALLMEDEAVAVVNSKKITLAKVKARLHRFQTHYKGMFTGNEDSLNELKQNMVDRMIEEELILQEAARKGVKLTKEELDAASNDALDPYPQANFEDYLAQGQLNRADWTERLRFLIISQRVIQQEVINKIPITKREIQDYYLRNRGKLKQNRAYWVKNITLPTEAEARMVRNKLQKGENVEALVAEYSISPDKDVAGDMGWIENGMLPAEMEDAIFRLSFEEKISPVVQSPDGYHIFYYVKRRGQGELTPREIEDQIRQIIIQEKQNDAYLNWLAKLKSNATIEINQVMLANLEVF